MYKKGDLVQITSCLLVDSCYGVKVGMKAKIIDVLGNGEVLLEFLDTSIQSLRSFLCTHIKLLLLINHNNNLLSVMLWRFYYF